MADDIKLDTVEARVLGVLIEKDLTTPDQYPLTLNAATVGGNQKSNRDPVMNLLDSEVNAALGKMIVKGLAGSVHPMGSRVEKFRHNTEAVLKIGTPQAAVLAELLMRGPQQPGELRSRVARMTPVETLPALMEMLKPMLESGLVVRLDPPPGSRAEIFAQTLAPSANPVAVRPSPAARAVAASPVFAVAPPVSPGPQVDTAPLEKRIADLEFHVGKLGRQLDALAWKLGEKLEP